MHEYLLRVRLNGETYTASVREIAPTQHPEVRIGAVAFGTALTAPGAMLAAIANARIPELRAEHRESHYAC